MSHPNDNQLKLFLSMKTSILKPMLNASMHLGHPVQKWNPQMKPFLYKKTLRSSITDKKHLTLHLIDLIKTIAHASYLSARLTKMSAAGQKILFVGTHRQYTALIAKTAKACNAYYINEKWLGGMLTNWDTISLSTDRLRKYDIVIQDGTVQSMPKKEAAKAFKEKDKLQRILGGIKYMPRKPDLVLILGQLKELNALKECRKLNIPSISIVDTNCNPMASDLLIPANDDSILSLQAVFNMIVFSIRRGQLLYEDKQKPNTFKRIYHSKKSLKRRRPRKRRPQSPTVSSSSTSTTKRILKQSTTNAPKIRKSRVLRQLSLTTSPRSNPFKLSFFSPKHTPTGPKVTESGETLVIEETKASRQKTQRDKLAKRMTKKPKALLTPPAWLPPDVNSHPLRPYKEPVVRKRLLSSDPLPPSVKSPRRPKLNGSPSSNQPNPTRQRRKAAKNEGVVSKTARSQPPKLNKNMPKKDSPTGANPKKSLPNTK